MKYVSGFLLGLIFSFVVRRSFMCFTGLIRDIYLMKQRYNAVYFATMIAVQGLIYFGLSMIRLVRVPSYLPPFSLFSIAIGSFMFGFGAVLSGGCMTMTLIKCGDGRVAGWIYLIVFILSAHLVAAGPFMGVSKYIRSIALVKDDLFIRQGALPVLVFLAATAVLWISLYKHYKKYGEAGEWPEELTPVLIGIILGIAYPVSGMTGRHFGVSITSPIMSFDYLITKPVETCGGCNPYDETFGWGSMFILGVIAGSFITAFMRGEFRVSLPNKNSLIKGVIGSFLMGIGSMWGLGCLMGNGIVGTAQLSLKSWYALVFLVTGIWTATKLTLINKYKL